MKVAYYKQYGAPDVVRFANVPKPTPGDNDVLIRVHATTVCSTDAQLRRGAGGPFRLVLGLLKPRRPMVGGVEFSGRVMAIGDAVTRFAVGDLVFGNPGFGKGTHLEYVCVPQTGMIELKPHNISMDEAAGLVCGGMTALGFARLARIKAGQNVLIYGASGAVGVFAVQVAKHLGARVTGVCGPHNQDLVRSLGADATVDYTREDFSAAGRVYDVIIDTVGKSGAARSLRALKRGGTYAQVAGDFVPNPLQLWAALTGAARVLTPLAAASIASDADALGREMARLKGLVESGALRPVIGGRFRFTDIADAHAYVDTEHKVGNAVVIVNSAACDERSAA